jgi:RHS repeat-associated protein
MRSLSQPFPNMGKRGGRLRPIAIASLALLLAIVLFPFGAFAQTQIIRAPLPGGWNSCNTAAPEDLATAQQKCDQRGALIGRTLTYEAIDSWSGNCRWEESTHRPSFDNPTFAYHCPAGFYAQNFDWKNNCGMPYKRYRGDQLYCSRSVNQTEPGKTLGPCNDGTCGVGNPISPGSGNKYQRESDYVGSGAFPLQLRRSYNSWRHPTDEAPDSATIVSHWPFGLNWRSNYALTVELNEGLAVSSANVRRADGKILAFTLMSGIWTPDSDISDRLVRLVDTSNNPIGWQFTNARDDSVEIYDVAGKLTSLRNRAGLTQTLTYSDSSTPSSIAPRPGLLIQVADAFGHTLTFTYDATNRVTGMVDPAGGTYTYAYGTANNLISVTYPDTKVRTYVYNETAYTSNISRPNALTGIIDESSVRFATFKYDSLGWANSTEHAGGVDKVTISYGSPWGQPQVVTDALGTVRNYSFQTILGVAKNTAVSQLCSGITCGRVSKSVTYDVNGNTASRKDFNDRVTNYTHDLARNLETSRTEAYGTAKARTITTAWHANYRVPTSITEPNRITAFTHDTAGNVLTRTITDTSVTPNVSRVWTYTYNSNGQVLTEDGPRTDVTDVTTYTYYSCTTGFQCGQLQTVENALGHITTYNTYNAHGQPTKITDANTLVTSLAYDVRRRLTDRCTGALLPACTGGELTHLDYWPTGQLKKVTNPDGSYIEYTYDAAHRLTQIQDGALNKIVYTLDNAGNRTAENTYDPSNALRRTHSRVFNTLNQLWKDVNAAGTAAVTTSFGYDSNGNQTSTQAPLSRNSTSLYDELNRLKQITDPASGITQFGYDANDNLTSVTDPRSLVTTYTYNGFGDLKTQTSPDTGVTTNTYDSGGNLDTSTDSRGAITDYNYDAANRVTSASFTLGGVTDQTLTYTYDTGTNQKGHLTAASDANHSLAWSYDPQGRITGKGQTTGGVTLSVGYGYNAAGQLSSTVLPSGAAITYDYNANGQVTSLTLNGSTTILSSITYDPFGPITSWTWGNGTAANRGFDTDGKITQVDNANGASLKNYTYDDAFRITGISDAGNSALSWTYGYDNLDRLNAASKSGTSQGWTYDANGNRLTQTGTTPSTYTNSGSSNRVSSITGSLPRTYAYDTAGNTLSYAGATFTYNHRGRMSSAANGGVTATYTYNALGQRIKRTASSVTTLYAYDEAGHLAGEYTATGVLIQETVWLGDTPVATLRPNGSGGVVLYYVHADHLNTPRIVTDTSNNVRWSWESDPFGTTIPNENPSSLGTFVYNLRFPGQQYDAVVGLHYNYFRDYDPASGRYAKSDPIGLRGGLNTYAYVRGNAVSLSDPRGLVPNPAEGACVAGPNPICIGGLIADIASWVGAIGLATGEMDDIDEESEGRVIPFPSSKPINKSCPPQDASDCEKVRQQLEAGKRALLTWSFVGLTLPDRVQQAADYNEQVRELNILIAVHNQKCPAHKVAPLPTIPADGKPD